MTIFEFIGLLIGVLVVFFVGVFLTHKEEIKFIFKEIKKGFKQDEYKSSSYKKPLSPPDPYKNCCNYCFERNCKGDCLAYRFRNHN